MSLYEELIKAGVKEEDTFTPRISLWKGPCSDDKMGGVTFSLLSRYIVCRERFRIHTIEGWGPKDKFHHRLEYGNMWHLCEEIYSKHKRLEGPFSHLHGYAEDLKKKYPDSQPEIDKWMHVCKVQFEVYTEWLAKNKNNNERTDLLNEYVFNYSYLLPSGRNVFLRGKWDGVFLQDDVIKLQENKTKGEIEPEELQRQLKFDLQTMLYTIVLRDFVNSPDFPFEIEGGPLNVGGVLYNVIRRPLSGGTGNIKPLKGSKNKPPETMDQYYKRLRSVIDGTGEYDTNPDYFFMRWDVDIDDRDIERFRVTCLEPLLENLCDDYEWYDYCCERDDSLCNQFNNFEREGMFPKHCSRHYVTPYGIWNPLLEGDGTPLDNYIMTGSTSGLERITNLFPELQK